MDPARRRYLRLCAGGAGLALAGCTGAPSGDSTDDPTPTDPGETPGQTETPVPKIDDWQYEPADRESATGTVTGLNATSPQVTYSNAASSSASLDSRLGFATGGAKNIAAFRRNIEEGYVPLPQSLAYEGLFYNYYFDTGQSAACESLFCPSYATAVSADPLGEETERYFTVGLNSNLTTESFERKQLNVVIVLDISGSMGAQFDQYYYDPGRADRTAPSRGPPGGRAVQPGG
jgi:Ca-activated chloride channel family protein